MKHFKLSTVTKVNALGITLFRVELTIDCKFGKKGDLGGWVEKEANIISGNAWVSVGQSIAKLFQLCQRSYRSPPVTPL